MKRVLLFVLCILMLMGGLAFAGCEAPEEPEEVDPEVVEWPSQAEVVAAIDEVLARHNIDEIGARDDYDHIIEELREVIPRPPCGYPVRTIEYLVPWGEGGGSDNYARHSGYDAAKIMDQTIIYNSMPGGGGEVALAHLNTMPPDGYTLYGAIANQTINDALGVSPHSFTEDFDFVIKNQGATEIYWVLPDSPFENIHDMLDYAVENPGELTICGAGVGGDDEFRIASLESELGTDIIYVPYDAVGERVSSLLGGHVDVMHETVGTVIDLYEGGEIRPLAIGGDMRFEDLDPDVPCIGELGYDVPIGRWRGVMTVGGTDPKIVDYLHNVWYASTNLPFYKVYEVEFFQHLPDAYLCTESFKEYAIAEKERVEVLARELGYLE